MADSPLNHSWPSFSKLWMKRWSFKRASECKPCTQPGGLLGVQQPSAPTLTSPSSSLSPASIAEDVHSKGPSDDQDTLSEVSDYDCPCEVSDSVEDLPGLSPSLRDCEYFKDLEEGIPSIHFTTVEESQSLTLETQLPADLQPVWTSLVTPSSPVSHAPPSAGCSEPAQEIHKTLGHLFPKFPDYDDIASLEPPLDLTINLNGLLRMMETPNGVLGSKEVKEEHSVDLEGELEMDSFPILVRSMSTSRRHSWGVPVSPINLGRRLSLDTMAMDSDGERDDEETFNSLFESTQGGTSSTCVSCTADEMDGLGPRASRLASRPPHMAASAPARHPLFRSDLLTSNNCSRTEHISRVVDTSKQAARASGDLDLEEDLQSTEGQSHIAKQRNNRAESKESGNVTWYEFLSNENEDEEERAEKVERGTKVRRKFSSLRNRMTGSFNKDKGKNRDKEQQQREKGKEAKDKARTGHHLVPGSFSSCATCSLCSKALQKKHGLQCMNCAVNVHKSCKSLLGECTSSTKKRESPQRSGSSGSSYAALRDSLRERWDAASSQALDGPPGSVPTPGMTISQRGASAQPTAAHPSVSALALNSGHSLCHHSSSGSLPGEMDETDALRFRRYNEDAVSLAPSTTESIVVEEACYAAVRAELDADAQDLEAESWSLAVEPQHVKKHTKEMVKRQDVIYELMQTEMHHVRTLKIMLRVYVRELRDNLQLDSEKLECIFPRLESLLELHTLFLTRLKERQRESLLSPGDRNYTINTLADVLIAQFSGDVGQRMKDGYGDFCSRHTEAVSCYKEQMQSNKKFHNMIRKINNLSIVRRLGVPECMLLVTQRITKYPVLVERILSNTEAGTAEHEELSRSLALIKDTIVQVDAQVNLHEKSCRLRDIHSKMEPKAQGKIKDGRVFRREDLAQGRRRLLHDGTVNWKAASGRLKDILAVLLSDVLLLLQEKDQRYVFAAVDNKPPVISLQKLIVREVAHEEKAMFLICASSNEPEMYKIHTNSKEERNSWMTHIRQAVESCPHTEERLFSEEEEEARAFRFKEFQERLSQKDAVISQALTEKLQLFADLAESVIGPEDTASRSRLLLRGDATDLQQGEMLLKGAIADVENLQNLLQSKPSEEAPSSRLEDGNGSGALPRRAVTFGGYDSSPSVLSKNGSGKKNFSGEARTRDRSQRASSDPQLKDLCGSHTLEQTVDESDCSPARWSRIWSNSFPEAEFYTSVLMLSQKLYSIQAVISQWDSHVELQRASLPGRHKGNVLLEQEKQRTLALQREELASFHKLQSQHRQEQQRWERERERHRQQAEAAEARLRQREEECRRLEEHLAEERKELESQKETYQQDLERLRESTRAVEREKERLENQKKIKRKTIEVAPLPGSLNGELFSSGLASTVSDLPLLQKPLTRGSLSVAPADYAERPEVTLRRETSSSGLPLKTEVPLHLFSTTNQLHRPVGLQQQIPTKLAAFSSSGGSGSKGKAGKTSKASHRTDSTASVDMRQMLPLKLSARDDASLKAKRSISPHQQQHQHHSHQLQHFADQLAPLDPSSSSSSSGGGPDTQKPPVVPPPPGQPSAAPPPHSHSVGSFQFQSHLQPPGPSAQLHGLSHSHSVPPPPYKSHGEDLNKEDVIFF